MTAQICQMTMPAGAESAGLNANDTAISGDVAGQDGLFSGLMAHFDGAAAVQAVANPVADDAMLPPDGEVLPEGLPLADTDTAAIFTLPQPPYDSLAMRLREALAAHGLSGSVARGQDAAAHAAIRDLLQPGASLPAGEGFYRHGAFRYGDGVIALPPELAQTRVEPAGLAAQLAAQLPASAVSMNTWLQRQGDASGTLSPFDGVRGLIRAVESAPSDLLPSTTTSSGHQLPSLTQGIERSLPGWTLSTPLQQAQQWGDEIGQRIRWMVGSQVHAAELRINPPQLGPIEVRVSVHNDQMNISFLTHHALVRDTLEDAIPRLRDMLNQQGFTSVNVDVSHHQAREGQDQGGRESGLLASSEPGLRGSDSDSEQHSVNSWSTSTGVIDLYA